MPFSHHSAILHYYQNGGDCYAPESVPRHRPSRHWTGANIRRLRQTKGLSVRDLQQFFGLEEPQAIYKWQRGQSLPTVDNLYALSAPLDVPMNDILVAADLPELHICTMSGRSEPAAHLFCPRARGHGETSKPLRPLSAVSGPDHASMSAVPAWSWRLVV